MKDKLMAPLINSSAKHKVREREREERWGRVGGWEGGRDGDQGG